MHDLVVVGGGVIGLATARQVAARGARVLLLNHGAGQDAASWAAAGMLAPYSEASTIDDPLFLLGLASLDLYDEWISRIHEEGGVDPEYSRGGVILGATTDEGLCLHRRKAEWLHAAGYAAELLTPEEVFRIEPQLRLPLAGALLLPAEGKVTPRALVRALRASCVSRGVETRDETRAEEIVTAEGRVKGIQTRSGFVPAAAVVIASGVGSAGILGTDPPIPVAPRKGQILSLETTGQFQIQRPVRWEQAYAVPRPGGELVIGATDEDAGFDTRITPAGVGRLLAAAQQLSPKVANLAIKEIWSGFRPATPDRLPVIGRSRIAGLYYATGHYRNGILLAPITALAVANIIMGEQAPADFEPFSPSRLTLHVKE